MADTSATDNDTRSAMMKQAARLFAERGYDAVSVREVVEAAGVTKPALYYHFASKEGLARALVDDFYHRADETRERAFETTESLSSLIETHTRDMLNLAREFRNTLAFGFSLWFGRNSLRELLRRSDERDCRLSERWKAEFTGRGLNDRAAGIAVKAYTSLLKQELMRVAQSPDWEGCADLLADEITTLVLKGVGGFDEGIQG